MDWPVQLRNTIFTGLALLMLTSCGSTPIPVQHTAQTDKTPIDTSRIYLLRGLFDVFSLGMDDIGDQLAQFGINASVHSGPSWPQLADQIATGRRPETTHGKLIISGHSYGADDSIRLARALKKHGVRVDALVLVDPTTPPRIPGNVNLVVNIYRSHPATDWMPWLRGIPIRKHNAATRVVNHDVRIAKGAPGLGDEINHFNIDEHPTIQNMVINEIRGILGAGDSFPDRMRSMPENQ